MRYPLFFLFYCCSLLAPAFLPAQVFPTTKIQDQGDNDRRINMVYLAEGYQADEMPQFLQDVAEINSDLFSQSPFSNYAAFFNAFTIEVPSEDSGTDHPGTATDVNEPAFPVVDKNTYFDSQFDYFEIHRLLVPNSYFDAFSVLANNVPQFDQPFMIVNSNRYGGSGGQFATTSTHNSANEIAIHEIGHSFANLADEYYAGDFYAREAANMTEETNPELVLWDEWYGEQGVGIYQHCCGNQSADWHRPHQDCKMRSLGSPFCAVCKQQIIDVIYSLVSPIDSFFPLAQDQVYSGDTLEFDLQLVYPQPNTLTVSWELNGVEIAAGNDSLLLTDSLLVSGMNTLRAVVTDSTELSRTYLPAAGYRFSQLWMIDNTVVGVESFTNGLAGETAMFGALYPNPPTGNSLFADYRLEASETVECRIIDALGRPVSREEYRLAAGRGRLEIPLAGLEPGAYYCEFISGNRRELRRFVRAGR